MPRGRRPLGANVSGLAAALIVNRIEDSFERTIRDYYAAGHVDLSRQLGVTLADLREAARQHRACTASEPGNAETVDPVSTAGSESVVAPPSAPASWVDVRAAAEALDVTERRARQLLVAGTLAGRRDRTGRWSVDKDDLHRLVADRKVTT